MRESTLQISCVDYLHKCAHPDVIYWHTPNGGKQTDGQRIHGYKMGVLSGFPDFAMLRHGKPHFIEFKVGYNKLTEDQEKVEQRIRAQGLPYVVIRTIDEFMDLMKSWDMVRQDSRY